MNDELGRKLVSKKLEMSAKRRPTLLDRLRVDFMNETGKPGDATWPNDPEFEEGANQYYVIKENPHYENIGSKLYNIHDNIGRGSGKKASFKKLVRPIDFIDLDSDI